MGVVTTTVLALTAIGLTAYGKYQEGAQAAEAEAYNRELYLQQASAVEAKKKLEAERAKREKAKVAGALIAKTAKAGLLLSGSPMEAFLDSMTQFALDSAITQYNLEVEKRRYESAADRSAFTAQQYKRSGIFNAFTSVLTMGMQAKTMGMLGGTGGGSSTGTFKPTGGYPGGGSTPSWVKSQGYLNPVGPYK